MIELDSLTSMILPTSSANPHPKFTSKFSAVEHHSVVRITGGCAHMSSADAANMNSLFRKAFLGFSGVLLVGGTRMVDTGYLRATMSESEDANSTEEFSPFVPGITDVGRVIKRQNPNCVLLGVIPRSEGVGFNQEFGILEVIRSVKDDPGDRYAKHIVTIVQSDMDAISLLLKPLQPRRTIWEDEAYFCARIVQAQRESAGWDSALVVYNGGQTTEYEIRLTAESDSPVILIRGSGRIADRLAADAEFLEAHPSVQVCDLNPESLRNALVETGTITPPPGQHGRLRAVS